MEPNRTGTLRRVIRILMGLGGIAAIGLGGFLVWFTLAWADAWGGEPDLAPGLGSFAVGAGFLIARRWLRPRRAEPTATRDRS